MQKPSKQHERTDEWNNLARLYHLPEAARHDRTGWSQRHLSAMTLPRAPFERAFVSLLGGWLLYADAHRNAYESVLGEDGVLGPCWESIGRGLRGLLNGELDRLDGGTLDTILCETLQANGIEEEA